MRTVESIVNEARQRLVCAKDWDEKSYEGTEVARLYARKYADAEYRAAFTLLDSLWQRCAVCQFKTWIEDLTLDHRLCQGCDRDANLFALHATGHVLTAQDVAPL